MATISPAEGGAPAARYGRGFTLLEIMIALLILSIGLLGLAGLQANGLRQNNNALMRTYAMIQAYDMAERMRANPAGVSAGNYALAAATTSPADPGQYCIGTGSDCNAAQLAAADIFEWWQQTNSLLPSGTGSIQPSPVAGGTGNEWTITVMWDEERTGATGTGCGPDPTVDLKCYTLTFDP